MVATITRIQTQLNFLLNQILICCAFPKYLKVRHFVKQIVYNINVPIINCILLT
jgi:hypothetical protein